MHQLVSKLGHPICAHTSNICEEEHGKALLNWAACNLLTQASGVHLRHVRREGFGDFTFHSSVVSFQLNHTSVQTEPQFLHLLVQLQYNVLRTLE